MKSPQLIKTFGFFALFIFFYGCTEENYYTCENPPQNLGIVNIYIEGNISTADAQAKIDAELGTLTENIYIENTTQLTTLSIKLLSNNIRNIRVNENSALETLNIDGNGHNMHTMYVYDIGKLTYLNLKGIKRMQTFDVTLRGYTPVINNKAIKINDLEILDGFFKFITSGDNNIFRCPDLKHINYNINTSFGMPSVMVGKFQEIDFSMLEETKWIYFAVDIETLTLPKLKKASALTIVFGQEFDIGFGIQNINLPELLDCNTIEIYRTTSNDLIYGINPTVNMPNLSQCNNIRLGNLSLDATKINAVLHQFLNIQPAQGKTIDLSSSSNVNYYNSPPTGQGLIDKQTLINQGNTVITN
jgi:hypothetical protein